MFSRILNIFSVKFTLRPFFWGFFSCCLFFVSLYFLLIRDFFPFYFAFLSIVFLGLIFFLRTIGLYIVFIGLLPFFYLTFRAHAVFEMALLYSLTISYFIALLSLEEDQEILVYAKESPKELIFNEWEEKSKNWNEEKRKLQETLEQLKEEAERRRLETSVLHEALVHAQSEGRALLMEKEKIQETQQSFKEVLQERQALHENLVLARSEIENLCREKEGMQDSYQSLKQALQESQTAHENLSLARFEIDALCKERHEILERMKSAYEEVSLLNQQLLKEQEKCQEIQGIIVKNIETERSLKHILGQYNQLRQQFEEKTNILSQVRCELFQTQGKLLAMEREKAHSQLDYDTQNQENSLLMIYEKESEESDRLGEEIKKLEDLVSDLLF